MVYHENVSIDVFTGVGMVSMSVYCHGGSSDIWDVDSAKRYEEHDTTKDTV